MAEEVTICSWRWIDVSESHVHTAVRQGFWNIFGHFLGDTLQGATQTTKYSRSTFGGFLRWGSIHEIIGLSVHYKTIHFDPFWEFMETPISGGSMGQRKQHKSFSAEILASGMLLGKCWVHQWFQKPHEWSCGSCCWAQCPHHLGSTVGRPVGQGVDHWCLDWFIWLDDGFNRSLTSLTRRSSKAWIERAREPIEAPPEKMCKPLQSQRSPGNSKDLERPSNGVCISINDMLCCPPISSQVLSQPPRYPLGWFEHEPTRRDHDSAGRARKMQTRPQWSWPHGTSTYGLGSEGSEQKQRRQIHVANSISICYHMLIYAPCSVFLPTFGWFAGQMLVNMPYMEHMGYPPTMEGL